MAKSVCFLYFFPIQLFCDQFYCEFISFAITKIRRKWSWFEIIYYYLQMIVLFALMVVLAISIASPVPQFGLGGFGYPIGVGYGGYGGYGMCYCLFNTHSKWIYS